MNKEREKEKAKVKALEKKVAKLTIIRNNGGSNRNKQKKNNGYISKQVKMPVMVGQRSSVVNNRTARIQHTEYIGAVRSGANEPNGKPDEVDSYTVQPAWNTTFPWLAAIANRYEKYKFQKLKFLYQPILGTTVPGMIVMSYSPDPSTVIPTVYGVDSRMWQMSHRANSEGSVFLKNELTIPPDSFKWLFTHQDLENDEPRTSHNGIFSIGIYNAASEALTTGELLVQYEIEFMTPMITPIGGSLMVDGVREKAPLVQQVVVVEAVQDDPDTPADIFKESTATVHSSATAMPVHRVEDTLDWTVTYAGKDMCAYDQEAEAFKFLDNFEGVCSATVPCLGNECVSTTEFTPYVKRYDWSGYQTDYDAQPSKYVTKNAKTSGASSPSDIIMSWYGRYSVGDWMRFGISTTVNLASIGSVIVTLNSILTAAVGFYNLIPHEADIEWGTLLRSHDKRRIVKKALRIPNKKQSPYAESTTKWVGSICKEKTKDSTLKNLKKDYIATRPEKV